MEIILHLGAHRCATTTLQHFLRRNTEPYRQAGLEIWTPAETRAGLFEGLILNPSRVTPLAERQARRSAGRIEVELTRIESRATRQILISEENIIGACRSNLRDRALYPDVRARLERFLPALGRPVCQIGLSIRSYESYWSSALALAISRGLPAPSSALIERLASDDSGWRRVISGIAESVPDAVIAVWPFEAFASDPARQVEAMTGGLRPAAVSARSPMRHHASPSGSELLRILTMRGEDACRLAAGGGGGRWMPFRADQRAHMRRRYLADLDWLASGAGPNIRYFGPVTGTAEQRWAEQCEMLDRASDVSGFAASARPWMPLNGGRGIGNERRMV